jgi:two-component system response regulator HydG
MGKEKILVVDDSPETLEMLRRTLTTEGYRVFTAVSVAEAIRLLDEAAVDLLITDLRMPNVSGLELVRHVRENHRDTEVMMITGYATVEGAVEAIKTGAEEYLPKPFTDEELFAAVGRSLEKLGLRRAAFKRRRTEPRNNYGIVGESKAMKRVFQEINKAAGTSATVLITGESGTGKELVARAIHYNGSRAQAPFVPVNCGGIPEGLLESELFGYVKGAFTGANQSRAGFFQTAEGGTIFLDEISETSLAMQVKLLRVLQDKEVSMVGSAKSRKIDIRILTATNKDLRVLMERGHFREDLYYRLNVINIEIPPLRERGEDVLLLARHFVGEYALELDRPPVDFTPSALRVLVNYSWPGNVRELENLIQRLMVMVEGETLDVVDLPSHMRYSVPSGGRLTRTLAEVEVEYIRNVLEDVGQNKTRAAKVLGIDRKTLREKLNRYQAKRNGEK